MLEASKAQDESKIFTDLAGAFAPAGVTDVMGGTVLKDLTGPTKEI
jgi:hypothetical protein